MSIRGNTVGTTMQRPDFNENNPRKAGYILNRPLDDLLPKTTEKDNGKTLKVVKGKWAVSAAGVVISDDGEGNVTASIADGGKLIFADDGEGNVNLEVE